MTADLDALEALAKAATPGPWDWYGNGGSREWRPGVSAMGGQIVAAEVWDEEGSDNAAYIAAADPSTVLALIAELRQERERADEVTREYELILTRQGVRVVMAERDAAVAALSRAEETIARALAITDNANISSHHWMLRETRAILTEYKQKEADRG